MNNKITFFTLLLLSLLFLSADGAKPDDSFADKPSKGPVFSIEKGIFKINDKVISRKWAVDEVKKSIGQSDRIAKLANTIHTYDAKGILLYERTNSGKLTEIQLLYSKSDIGYYPKHFFEGSFFIEGKKISSADLSLEGLQRLWPEYNFKRSFSHNTCKGEKQGLYIYVHFASDFSKINRISFGPNWQ